MLSLGWLIPLILIAVYYVNLPNTRLWGANVRQMTVLRWYRNRSQGKIGKWGVGCKEESVNDFCLRGKIGKRGRLQGEIGKWTIVETAVNYLFVPENICFDNVSKIHIAKV